ncbi:MAG: hypothetical protein AAF688_15435, partial [Bacteroidota bacterium]
MPFNSNLMLKIGCLIILINSFIATGQVEREITINKDTLYYPNYPDGIYENMEDFLNRTPSSTEKVNAIKLYKTERITDSLLEHNIYFFSNKTKSKIRNVFATSYKGQLYFQIKAILKNRNKTDRAQKNSRQQSFVRVIMGGENYLYTEVELANQWATGTAYNFGLVGSKIAQDLIKGKGVVWDFARKEFNIFKSCKDYNVFIEDKLKSAIQKCENHQPRIFAVRRAIEQ